MGFIKNWIVESAVMTVAHAGASVVKKIDEKNPGFAEKAEETVGRAGEKIEKAAEKAEKATEEAIKTLGATFDKLEAAYDNKIEKVKTDFLDQHPDHYHLFMIDDTTYGNFNTTKTGMKIVDENQNLRYFVKSSLFSNHYLKMYTAYGKLVGRVIQQRSSREAFTDYEIEVEGEYIGKILSKLLQFNVTFRLKVWDWYLEGNIIQGNFYIYDGDDNEIMHFERKLGVGYKYQIDYAEKKSELPGLLILCAIVSIHSVDRHQQTLD